MTPRRFATDVLPACAVGLLAAWGTVAIETRGASPIMARIAPSLAANAEVATAPRARVIENAAAGKAEVATVEGPTSLPIEPTVASHTAEPIVEATVTDPAQRPPSETPPVQAAALEPESIVDGVTDSTQQPQSETPPALAATHEAEPIVVAALTDPSEKLPSETPTVPAATTSAPDRDARTLNSVAIFDECFVADSCIDRYLWALYRRTPKEDTIKVEEQTKVTVKRKGKMVTVTRTSTRLVDEDFGWKDPKAADKVSMTMMDYVIGGMDRSFKLKLFNVLRAAEQAGLSPGITSAFRDDYRQSIAAGLKAANDRSYHGGSFRGGYGHGLAADIVSVNGATRAQRQTSSEALWKWVDAHGQEFGIGRPYLDRDPPHVAPVDGKEYASHRGAKSKEATSSSEKRKRVAAREERGTKSKAAKANSEKRKKVATREDRSPAKRLRTAKSSKASS
jgi:hypothetical protein